jgi:hypothetical protein
MQQKVQTVAFSVDATCPVIRLTRQLAEIPEGEFNLESTAIE